MKKKIKVFSDGRIAICYSEGILSVELLTKDLELNVIADKDGISIATME